MDMESFWHFIQSEQVTGLLIAAFIFFITILAVAKSWINFPITLLLLLFSLVVGLAVSNQSHIQSYYGSPHPKMDDNQDTFNKQMKQAFENLQSEVDLERDNILRLMSQVMEIVEKVDAQKQKLQNFIEEARPQFNQKTSDKKIAEDDAHG